MVVGVIVWVDGLVLSGGFLLGIVVLLATEVHALIDFDIHLFQQNAVSWDSIALLDVNNVSDNKFSYWY